MNDFVDDWGEEALGPLAEPFLSGTTSGDDDGDSDDATSGGGGCEELSELWPRLSQIHEGMEDLEASRTKVDLARQIAVDGSNPESIVHAVGKVLVTTRCARKFLAAFSWVVLFFCLPCFVVRSVPFLLVTLHLPSVLGILAVLVTAGVLFRFEVS